MLRSFIVVLVAAIVPCLSSAQQKKDTPIKIKAGAFMNATEAGPDFKIQGEYEGKLGSGQYGAQVVALGDGKFDVYFLAGGLPGAGWDKKTRTKVEARTEESKVALASKWTGTIADGKLTGKSPDDKEFALSKVERKSPTVGAKPPEGATILFDGTSAELWNGGKLIEDNLLYCGVTLKKGITLGKLHLEFRTPFQPKGRGQGRGNSGVYIHDSEVQVLDSFGLNGENNECGGWYSKRKPDVNMCFPPLSWQTYDVEIKMDGDNIVGTVVHNGVQIHENFVLKKGPVKPYSINLQNHGDPVVYRNIWFVEMK